MICVNNSNIPVWDVYGISIPVRRLLDDEQAGRMHVLQWVYTYSVHCSGAHAPVQIFLTNGPCETHCQCVSNNTPNLIANRSAVTEMCRRGVQLHAPLVMRIKRIASGPLTAHQISAQSVQPSSRYGKWLRTCCCTSSLPFRPL